MRIVFFGSGAFGLPSLLRLHERHQLLAIVTQPDKPAGRGSQLTPTPIGEWASAHAPQLSLLKPANVNTPENLELIRGLGADAWVVIAFGQKLSKKLLDGIFAVNLHASILPRWRGAAPINAAVLAGDSVTGNSVITLADKMDAGLVLGTSTRPIEHSQTAGQLHDALAADGPDLIESVLEQHRTGTLKPVTQIESGITLAGKFSKSDGWVDFADAADVCRARINGLSPWPGVTVQFRGQPLRVCRAGPVHAGSPAIAAALPGTILDRIGTIACGGGTQLVALEVQPAGKRAMPFEAFANGQRIQVGAGPDAERLIGGRP